MSMDVAEIAGLREQIAAVLNPEAFKTLDQHRAEWSAWMNDVKPTIEEGRCIIGYDAVVERLAEDDFYRRHTERHRALVLADKVLALPKLRAHLLNQDTDHD